MLVLLASLSLSYESLVIALLVEKSIMKMDEVIMIILHSEILKRENPASSSDGSSALAVSEEAEGDKWSDRRSQ